MKTTLLILLLVLLAIPVSAYIVVPVEEEYLVVPVEEWPSLVPTWTSNRIPPDVQIQRGVAPVFVSTLAFESFPDGLRCQGILCASGGEEIGAVEIVVSHEMLPVMERWGQHGAVIFPTIQR